MLYPNKVNLFRNGVQYIFEGASNIKTAPSVTARLKQITDPWGNQRNFAKVCFHEKM